MQWFRWKVTVLSLRRPGFDPRPVFCETFEGERSTRPFLYPSNSIFPSQCHSNNAPYSSSCTCSSFTRRTNGRCFGIIQKRSVISDIGENWLKMYFYSFHFSVHVRGFWWKKQHLDMFSSKFFCFSLSASFHRCSRPIFVLALLLIGRTSERNLGMSKIMPYSFRHKGNARRKVLSDNFIGLFLFTLKSTRTKLRIFRRNVKSVLLCGSETWKVVKTTT